MPALVAFGRRWQIASDDFVFPGLIDLIIRVSWILGACIIYWNHDDNLSCPGGQYMKFYLYGNFLVLLCLIFTDVLLIQSSMTSYIMDLAARKSVTTIIYVRLFLQIPEIFWNIIGTIWLFTKTVSCPDAPEAVTYIKVLIWFNWGLCLVMVVIIGLAFDPLGSYYTDSGGYERFENGLRTTRNTRVWEKRCRVFMCSYLFSDELSRDAFKEIGKIMALLFSDLDYVPSDLAAGLIILNLKSQAELGLERDVRQGRNNHKNIDSSSEDEVVRSQISSKFVSRLSSSSNVNYDAWNSPQKISHFMKYALGSYGWPWFLVANTKTGLCRLWENILCCGCFVSHPCDVEGDNCCYCNFSALKETVSIENRDILYASFKNEVFKTPFFVAIDHSTSSVIIAIRGTLSLRDAITDLTAEARPLGVSGLPNEYKAHYGMILTAKHVQEKLESLKILTRTKTMYPNYDLVLTGHSLGAGTAAILAIMLKNDYPNIKCYAYSPPGGLFTTEAATYCETFVTSVIFGDDIVARLSVPSFEQFKNKLKEAIEGCRVPKYRILMGGLWYLLVGGVPKDIIQTYPDDISEQRSDTQLLQGAPDTNYHTYVSLAEESHRLHREAVTKCPMYPPGKIMHVTERPIFNSRPDLVDGPRYEFRWADRSEFSEIIVTPNMWTHHYPDNVWRALLDIGHHDIL